MCTNSFEARGIGDTKNYYHQLFKFKITSNHMQFIGVFIVIMLIITNEKGSFCILCPFPFFHGLKTSYDSSSSNH